MAQFINNLYKYFNTYFCTNNIPQNVTNNRFN